MNEQTSVYHIPVLVKEVIEYLVITPGGTYVDATFGGGGHTRAILEHDKTSNVIAFDWDTIALEKNGEPLQEQFPQRLTLVWGNFSQLDKHLKKIKVNAVDGILADFGTSQYQLLNRPGFSFYGDTPLDMRMSPAHQKVTAYEIVNKASEELLIDIFRHLGEEPKAKQIARAILEQRKKQPIKTTRQLAMLVESLLGGKKRSKIHPATKIFQGLRIYINHELDNITSFLSSALRVLKPGGRLVCISFHSLEDRLVKQFFKQHEDVLEIITAKVVTASEHEIARNPSARSAKLRVAQMREKNEK